MKKYRIKDVIEIVSDEKYYYLVQPNRISRYNKDFKKASFIKMKNPSYVVSDIALNIVIVVNTASIVNVYSYDKLELLKNYKLDYDYRDSKYDNQTHMLYTSTYSSYIRINKLWSINMLTKEIYNKSMARGYIYSFITVNNNSLLINEVEVDPNGPISSIVKANIDFEILDRNTLKYQNINDFLNENLGYNCRCVYDIEKDSFHIFKDKGINEVIVHIKHCGNKYFLWSMYDMYVLDENFNYVKHISSQILYSDVYLSDDKFLVVLEDCIECYDSIEEYLDK